MVNTMILLSRRIYHYNFHVILYQGIYLVHLDQNQAAVLKSQVKLYGFVKNIIFIYISDTQSGEFD